MTGAATPTRAAARAHPLASLCARAMIEWRRNPAHFGGAPTGGTLGAHVAYQLRAFDVVSGPLTGRVCDAAVMSHTGDAGTYFANIVARVQDGYKTPPIRLAPRLKDPPGYDTAEDARTAAEAVLTGGTGMDDVKFVLAIRSDKWCPARAMGHAVDQVEANSLGLRPAFPVRAVPAPTRPVLI